MNSSRTIASVLGILLTCFTVGQAAVAQEYERYLAQGKELLEGESYEQAITAFEAAIGAATDGAEEARLGLATAQYRLSDYDKALGSAEGLLRETANEEMRAKTSMLTIEVLRALLRERSEGDAPRHARIRLCELRAELGDLPPSDPAAAEDGEADKGSKDLSAADVRPPYKIYAPQPKYSAKAKRSRIQGVVIAQAVIDRDGCVESIKVVKGLHPDLDQNALGAMTRWVFRPAEVDGEPAKVYYNLTVNFRLEPRKR